MTSACNDRKRLAQQYRLLIKQLAGRILTTIGPGSIACDDLVQCGYEALLRAALRFDRDRGNRFVTYAYQRIWGGMWDMVRRCLANRRRELLTGCDTGCLPLTPSAYRWGGGKPYDAPHLQPRPSEVVPFGWLPRSSNPEVEVENKQLARLCERAISQLDWRKRAVIRKLYYESWTQQQVAELLGVTRSWVSKLHTRAINELAAQLQSSLPTAA